MRIKKKNFQTAKKQLNILALIPGIGGEGGIERYNQELVAGFLKNDRVCNITLISRNKPQNCPYSVIYSSKKFMFVLQALWHAVFDKPDFIFCAHINFMPLAVVLAKFCAVPIWLQVHGIDVWKNKNKFVLLAAKQAAMVTSVSRHTRQQFCSKVGFPDSQVKILPNTFSENFAQQKITQWPKTAFHAEDVIYLLTVGRMPTSERYKGHDQVLKILAKIIENYPNLQYWVVGDGADRTRLEKKAENLGVAKQVIFFGKLDDEKLKAIYQQAHLFVMPSADEGFGIVFLEAAMQGLPSIAGNKDGSVDALQEGALGLLVDPQDEQALLDAVLLMLRGQWQGDLSRVQIYSQANFSKQLNVIVQYFVEQHLCH